LTYSKNDFVHFLIPAIVFLGLGIINRIIGVSEFINYALYWSAFFVLFTAQFLNEYAQIHNYKKIAEHGGLERAKENSKKDWLLFAAGWFVGSILFGVIAGG